MIRETRKKIIGLHEGELTISVEIEDTRIKILSILIILRL
jgi:hypothetical protein